MVLDRVNKLSALLKEEDINALIVLSKQNFIYLTDMELDYSALILTSDGKVYVVTHVLEEERAQTISYSPKITLYSSYKLPIDKDYYLGTMEEAIADVIKAMGIEGKVGYEGYIVSASTLEKLKSLLPDNISLVDATKIIWKSRLVKTPSEIEYIRKSCSILVKVMDKAISYVKPGVSEKVVAATAIYEALMEGGYTDIYPIVASGERSSLPHGRATTKVIREGEPVVLDLTARYNGYYSDMTRTIFVKTSSSELRRIYLAVKEAQEEAVDKVREGVRAHQVDEVARSILRKYGLDKYFIHSTGHSVGLDIHEPLRIASGVEEVLVEGMVITIEPGVYIRGVGGVRIEDTVLVRKSKAEILTPYTKELLFV